MNTPDTPLVERLDIERAKIVADILSQHGYDVCSPDDATLDHVEWLRFDACMKIVVALHAPPAPQENASDDDLVHYSLSVASEWVTAKLCRAALRRLGLRVIYATAIERAQEGR